MRVEYASRIDADTILCIVREAGANRRDMRLAVPVRVSIDELPEPQPVGGQPNPLDLREAPNLSKEIQLKAVREAQQMCRDFASIVPE
jgi:hypothetical protein